jgi:hypothetical protein
MVAVMSLLSLTSVYRAEENCPKDVAWKYEVGDRVVIESRDPNNGLLVVEVTSRGQFTEVRTPNGIEDQNIYFFVSRHGFQKWVREENILGKVGAEK